MLIAFAKEHERLCTRNSDIWPFRLEQSKHFISQRLC